MRTLRFTSGPAAGQSLEIERELVIGREGADLTIEDPELSRRHVALRPVGGGVEVEDLGSLNGTFVDGKRISTPLTLKSNAKLKLGTSLGTLEVSLPQATRMTDAPLASPDATVARPVASPDATVQRPTVDPEVTAQRPVPPSDVAEQGPDVTVERPVPPSDVAAQGPDVTAQRPVPPSDVAAQGPDVTVQRPVEAAGPPGTPPPAAPPEPAKGRGGPAIPLIVGALVLLALIVLAVLLLSGGEAEAEKRKVDYTHILTAPTAEDKRKSESVPGKEPITWRLTGRSTGRPFGTGRTTTTVTLQPAGPPPGAPKPTTPPPTDRPRTATVTVRFDIRLPNGTLLVTERLRSRRTATSIAFSGTARIIRGTGEFEGAKGTLKVTGGRPNFEVSRETARWTGTVEY